MDQQLPLTPHQAPPKRSLGLLWALIAGAVLLGFMLMDPAEDPEQQAAWITTQRQFTDEYALQQGVELKPSGLMIRHLEQGTGPNPTSESLITAHYEGRLIDGRVFDSSIKRGEPIVFTANQVIPGWREALPLMKVGGKAEVVIPAEMAYGAQARGDSIPAYSVLIFELHLLAAE